MGDKPLTVEFNRTFGVSGRTVANKNVTKNVALRIKPVPIDL
jgi:hypothetical protein